MSVTLITALIAALVTLVGYLVHIRIGREAATSGAAVRATSEADAAIKRLQKETELVRVRGQALVSALEREANPKIAVRSRKQEADAFFAQAEVFLDAWADTKPDVPPMLRPRCRDFRHDCRTAIAKCRGVWELSTKRSDIDLRNLVSDVQAVVEKLDTFNAQLDQVREEMIRKIEQRPYSRH